MFGYRNCNRGLYHYLPRSLKVLSGDLDIADDILNAAFEVKSRKFYDALPLFYEAREIYSQYNEDKSIKRCDKEIRLLKLEIADSLMDEGYKAKKEK